MPLPVLRPMLASCSPSRGGAGEWAYEPKLDGWRVLVYVDGSVTVRTRPGRNITSELPELAPLADALGGRQVVLDGELVAGAGRPWDFYRTRPSWKRRPPLTFVAFDVLCHDGGLVTAKPYSDRRALLEQLALTGPAWCTVPSYREHALDVFNACTELGLEGMVAKRTTSRYRPGERSADWVKVKTGEWRAAHAERRHDR